METTIKVEHITTFDTFQEWVNKASRISILNRNSEKIICIAKNGKSCNNGADMMFARDNDLFPVEAYRLIRTTEI